MSSISGVDLSSLLSALGSSSSGINVQAAVAQAIAAKSKPLHQWQQEQVLLNSQKSDITQIEDHISALQTSLNALGDPTGALASMMATSSNSSIVTASASAGTAAGNHVVVVSHLASTASWYSNSVASSSTPLSAGSFELQVGSGPVTQITIGNGVDTLDQLATYINGQGLGVNASVVSDSAGSRLALVSATSGSAANFTVSNSTSLNFTQAVTGTDASLTVDGIPIDSASNMVSGAVSGVTFNLASAAPGTEVNVSVAPDTSQASQAVSDFVDAYNAVIKDVNTEFTVASNGLQGPLAGDTTLRMLQNQLLAASSFTAGSSGISSLAGLGISMNNDGTLSLDDSKLSDAVQTNFSGVRSFLQGASSDGFASYLKSQMNVFTDPVDGAFTVDLQSISHQNDNLQNQIDEFQVYLQNEQQRLTEEYNKVDILLQQLPNEQAQINAQLGLDTKKS